MKIGIIALGAASTGLVFGSWALIIFGINPWVLAVLAVPTTGAWAIADRSP
jgi:hypothetical protein